MTAKNISILIKLINSNNSYKKETRLLVYAYFMLISSGYKQQLHLIFTDQQFLYRSVLTNNSCTDLNWPTIPVQICTNQQLLLMGSSHCQAIISHAFFSCLTFHEWNYRSEISHKTEWLLVVIHWNELDLVWNDVKCDIFSLYFFI